MEATSWSPPRNARGRVSTMRRTDNGEAVDYDSLVDKDFSSGKYYNACQCPCGCMNSARYFAADTSDRPYLCFPCVPPDARHERELTKDEQAIVELPA